MAKRPDSYTVADAAKEMGISEDAVRKRIKRNTIEHYRQDGRIYVVWTNDVDVELVDETVKSVRPSKKSKQASTIDDNIMQKIEMYERITDRNIELLQDQAKLLEDTNKALMKSLRKLGDRYQEVKAERDQILKAYKKLRKKCK